MDPNFEGLGKILFGFQLARWNIVELANHLDQNFIAKQGTADFVNTANDFAILAHLRPDWQELAAAFLDATKRFNALLACTPYTAAGGQQNLGSSDAGKYDWTDAEIADFVQKLETVSATATRLSDAYRS